jgi:hypothetical protein
MFLSVSSTRPVLRGLLTNFARSMSVLIASRMILNLRKAVTVQTLTTDFGPELTGSSHEPMQWAASTAMSSGTAIELPSRPDYRSPPMSSKLPM